MQKQTSFVVLIVGAGDLHCDATARSPPACVTVTAPHVLSQNALAIPTTQAWTPVWGGDKGRRKKRGRQEGKGSGEGRVFRGQEGGDEGRWAREVESGRDR